MMILLEKPAVASHRDGPIPLELSGQELRRKIEDKVGVLIACTCAKAGVDEAPIEGSLSRHEFHAILGSLPKDTDMALYCVSCIDDYCARWTASTLRHAGYRWVRVLVNGPDFR